METQPRISTTFDTLCELHKCGASLEINEKMKENIKRAIRKQNYVSLKKDQLSERQMNKKKK
jgi:hypothetical protein